MEKVFNIVEVAAALRVSTPTARKLIRAGTIRMVQVGRAWRITESAMSDFLRGGDSGGMGKAEMPQQAA